VPVRGPESEPQAVGMVDLDDPVLRSILTAINRSRFARDADQLAESVGIPLEELEAVLYGERPLHVVDAVRMADALEMSAKDLFSVPRTIPVAPPERLAYSLPAFADAVCLSLTTIREAIASGELVARSPTRAGRKPIITRADGLAWLRGLPGTAA
jgi:hypothetical protein